jgi:hypothetical protein
MPEIKESKTFLSKFYFSEEGGRKCICCEEGTHCFGSALVEIDNPDHKYNGEVMTPVEEFISNFKHKNKKILTENTQYKILDNGIRVKYGKKIKITLEIVE